MDDLVRAAKQSDGGLFLLGGYICWNYGEREITLDGQFTSIQLREFAEIMERSQT